jgi:hypothetical protein
MAQLIAVLKLVGKAEPEHVVVERLARISSEMGSLLGTDKIAR